MNKDREQILKLIRELKRNVLPDEKLILFGSQARKEAHEESDWDLLILLNKPALSPDDYDHYAYPFVELGWKLGEYFSTKLYTETDWKRRSPSLFYKNVQTDGIEIV
ncbi:putative nucleotidyltransferase [Bacteroidales bacterium Barb6]|nr:putative nucleotidyltransferase [Bacteroidales bacterium Barb6XT]OAV73235.1 putative nucleotidyltransferase [Bacteroidales bacterium Barb6]OAV75036.1 putative nucleotidyltransferase [Bacteroidales bacterium Barb7]